MLPVPATVEHLDLTPPEDKDELYKWLHRNFAILQVEDEHLVDATGEPAFENSWDNYPTVDSPARFYKTPQRRVYFAGLIDSGASSSVAFTLPELYRPEYPVYVAVEAETSGGAGGHGAHAGVIIGTDGTVTCHFTGTTVTWLSLDNISFSVPKG